MPDQTARVRCQTTIEADAATAQAVQTQVAGASVLLSFATGETVVQVLLPADGWPALRDAATKAATDARMAASGIAQPGQGGGGAVDLGRLQPNRAQRRKK